IGQGGLIAAIPLGTEPEWQAGTLCRDLASMDRIVAARVMLTNLAQTSIQTREKSVRSKHGAFAGLLLIEGLDETSVRHPVCLLPALAPLNRLLLEELPLYALCFKLDRLLLSS